MTIKRKRLRVIIHCKPSWWTFLYITESFFSNAWLSETRARQVTWEKLFSSIWEATGNEFKVFIGSRKKIAHYNIFHWKWNQNADTQKNTASWKRRWSAVQVCLLSKETLDFVWQRGTRVAKLNEHLLCNFGANSKLWAANWPITGRKQTYLYDKFISVMKFLSQVRLLFMHNHVTFNLLPSASQIISMEEFLLFSYNLRPAPQLNFVSWSQDSCCENAFMLWGKTRF